MPTTSRRPSPMAVLTFLSTALPGLLGGSEGRAAEVCQYFLSIPINCKRAVSGGAYPSFSDAFNISPAAIPTVATPLGLEAVASGAGSSTTRPEYNVALIKGYDRFGGALSTNNDRTFYTFNLAQAYAGTRIAPTLEKAYAANTQASSMNLGAALAPPLGALEQLFRTSLGAGLRYNQLTQKWDLQLGLSLSGDLLSLGYSSIKKQGKAASSATPASGGQNTLDIPAESLQSFDAGVHLGALKLEYTLLKYASDYESLGPPYNLVFRQPVHIGTVSLKPSKPLLLTTAYRTFIDLDNRQARQWLLSTQYFVRANFTLGYAFNHIPGAHSISAQYFFF